MKNSIKTFIAICLFPITNLSVNAKKIYYPQAFFDEKEAQKMLEPGNSTIKGIAFTHAQKALLNVSAKQYAAASIIVLIPYTRFMDEWYNLRRSHSNAQIYMPQKVLQYTIQAKTDDYGNFTFTRLKPGIYYLECLVNFTGSYRQQYVSGYYVNGYGGFAGNAYDYYTKYYNGQHLVSNIIEITQDGQLIETKLKNDDGGSYSLPNKPKYNECYMDKGLQQGSCIEYDSTNGKVKGVFDWKDNMLDGHVIRYYGNGKVYSEGDYKKGGKIGPWHVYYEDGTLENEYTCVYKNKMGMIEGEVKIYSKKGTLSEVQIYKDNIPISSISYYPSGKIKAKGDLDKDGNYVSGTVWYDEQGNVKTRSEVEKSTFKE
jgi:antitoxin component YwqK of YwqJK toxin-antitoxin module